MNELKGERAWLGGERPLILSICLRRFFYNYFRGRIKYSHFTGVGQLGCSDVAF